ncbi:DUF1963 domain-containing protein [Streptomonospora nanhaiensis]|uniref:DUF1963 domain-containing protein n=1 Tax=Streptomonospora nanhaiensis TaxID=1323731 RepID=UPI001C9A19FC|nr:DUF1963 domain-containing protein [Streptomonospora nanhaiensis]MBX9388021.1 DUF1963 domain-containing protein [Streptomonospora nanhaiensis]
MRPHDLKTSFHRLCVTHLGADTGPRVAALARTGFHLDPVGDPADATGRFRFGGRALLDPGTPWPESEGRPMPLLAVVDTDALAPWLDLELPPGSGLLNVFYIGAEDDVADDIRAGEQARFESPVDWRVVPADSATAADTAPPAGGVVLPERPVRAAPMLALPDTSRVFGPPVADGPGDAEVWDAFERVWERLPDLADGDRALPPFANLPADLDEDTDESGHRAFGWPWPMQGGPMPDTGRIHLLQLDTDPAWTWADCGMVTFDIPAPALRAGDFTQVDCYLASC